MPAREQRTHRRQTWLLILSLWCVLCVVVVAYAVSEVSQWERRAEVSVKVAATFTRVVFDEANDIAKWMTGLARSEGLDSEEAFRRLMSRRHVHLALADRIGHSPEIDVASFIDVRGQLASFSRFWPAVIDLSDRDYVAFMHDATVAEVFISAPVQNKVTSAWNVFVARRVQDAEGGVIGLAIVGLKLSAIHQFFRETSAANASVVSIFRNDKVLLVNNAVDAKSREASWGRRFEEIFAFKLLSPDGRALPAQLTGNIARLTGRLKFPYRIVAAARVERYPLFAASVIDGSVFSEKPIKLALVLAVVGFLLSVSIVLGARSRDQLVEAKVRELLNTSNESLQRSLTELSEDKSAVLSADGTSIIFANRAFQVMADNQDGSEALPKLAANSTVKAFFSDPSRASLDTVFVLENMKVPGHFCFFHITARRVRLEAVGDCIVMQVRDETLHREQQSIAVQSTKMIALGQMAAGIAHEINQPLNVIRMASENALHLLGHARSSPGDFEPIAAVKKKITRVLGQVDRMELITSGMRDYVRSPNMVKERFSIATAIGQAVAFIVAGTRNCPAVVVEDIDPSLEVIGPAPMFEQVIVNLLLNAVLALSKHPIANPKIVIQAHERPGGRIVIHVGDNGPGVSAMFAEKIFEPFFTTNKLGDGTGLGLFLSNNWIKEAFGGALTLTPTAPDGGATFEIVLPKATSDAPTVLVRG